MHVRERNIEFSDFNYERAKCHQGTETDHRRTAMTCSSNVPNASVRTRLSRMRWKPRDGAGNTKLLSWPVEKVRDT